MAATQPLEKLIGDELRRKHLYLVLAESCTGGLVGDRVTNIPGSSDYYLGSVAAYAYEAKEHLLGVQHTTLMQFGAVSRETVLEMARGARAALSGSFPLTQTVGISISGIAGPGGGTPEKPVGTVWIGMSTPEGDAGWRFLWRGTRRAIKRQAATEALRLLYEYLQSGSPRPE